MNKKWTYILLIIEAMFFIGIISYSYNKQSNKVDILEQNLKAERDELTLTKLENGKLLKDQYVRIIKEKELIDELDMTKKEKKELEKKLGEKIAHITKLESNVRIDTVSTVKDSIIYLQDSTTIIKFKYDDKWLSFNGLSNLNKKTTELFNINIPVPLEVGLTNDYNFFVISENPYLNISYVNSNVVDGSVLYKKPKKWNFGIQFGFGVHYGTIGKNFDVGPYGGFGIQYNF